jgi:predicted ArsR family transcriptional regulator
VGKQISSLELACFDQTHTPSSSTTAPQTDPTTREQIEEFIAQHPGAHLREIKRELKLAMGVIQYHLYSLEKEKKILSHHRGLYKRFYPNLVFGESQQDILDVLSQETERDLLLYLISNPGATQKQLSEYAQISAGTINWHMKRLIDSGLAKSKREGPFAKYEVKCDPQEVLRLLQAFHPRIWERWADRFANTITETTASSNTSFDGEDKEQ